MNWKVIGLGILLFDFLGLTTWAVYEHGLVGVLAWAFESPAAMLFAADLVIALSLILAWMVRDARERGRPVLPYVALTLALGSAGPLAYLIARERGTAEQRASAIATAA